MNKEMSAIRYLEIKSRMTNNCKIRCGDCLLIDNKADGGCFQMTNPEEAVRIVTEWGAENPVKSYADVLLNKFPMAKVGALGIPTICVNSIFGEESVKDCTPFAQCRQCWMREYEGE